VGRGRVATAARPTGPLDRDAPAADATVADRPVPVGAGTATGGTIAERRAAARRTPVTRTAGPTDSTSTTAGPDDAPTEGNEH